MDKDKLKRNPKKVHEDLKTLEDGSIVTQGGCKVIFPVKYQEQGLAKIGVETYVLGFFVILIDDKFYGVSKAPTKLHMAESEINTITIDDEDHYEFVYQPGDRVIVSNEALKDDVVLYDIYNEFISKGNIPWFFEYEDVGKIFEHSGRHAGMKLGANHAIIEMIASAISRDPNNLNKYYRHFIENDQQQKDSPPTIIKLNSVSYGATNTTAKLIGGYWDEGVTSALVNPSDRVEPIEEILRR